MFREYRDQYWKEILKEYSEWNAPSGVPFIDHVGRDDLAVVAKALLYMMEKLDSQS